MNMPHCRHWTVRKWSSPYPVPGAGNRASPSSLPGGEALRVLLRPLLWELLKPWEPPELLSASLAGWGTAVAEGAAVRSPRGSYVADSRPAPAAAETRGSDTPHEHRRVIQYMT